MLKKISIVLGILALIISSVILFSQGNEGGEQKKKITVNMYPAYELVNSIINDDYQVELINEPGLDAHDFEPTGKQILEIQNSDVFVYFDGIGEWEDDVISSFEGDNQPIVVNLSEKVDTLQLDEKDSNKHDDDHEDEEKHDDEHEDDHKDEDKHDDEHDHEDGDDHDEHDHGDLDYDPHIWLDPTKMRELAIELENELGEDIVDSKKVEEYTAKLVGLDNSFSSALSQCNQSKIVTSHEAFGYMGARYGFEILTIQGIDSTQEPSPMELAELVEQLKTEGLNTILVETQISPDFSNLIADEVDGVVNIIYSIESPQTSDINEFGGYFGLMEENKKVLTEALGCGKI